MPALLDFFLAGRRPAGWNQWAEVVGRDPREPLFIGDMPHGWVASDFIRSFLDLFAYERPRDRALVLAAGIPSEWLARGQAVGVRALRTPYGLLTYSMRRAAGGLRVHIAGDLAVPPGGLVLRPPLPGGLHPLRRLPSAYADVICEVLRECVKDERRAQKRDGIVDSVRGRWRALCDAHAHDYPGATRPADCTAM